MKNKEKRKKKMIKIVGIESLDYENKQGKHVTGVKVHYNDM